VTFWGDPRTPQQKNPSSLFNFHVVACVSSGSKDTDLDAMLPSENCPIEKQMNDV